MVESEVQGCLKGAPIHIIFLLFFPEEGVNIL